MLGQEKEGRCTHLHDDIGRGRGGVNRERGEGLKHNGVIMRESDFLCANGMFSFLHIIEGADQVIFMGVHLVIRSILIFFPDIIL